MEKNKKEKLNKIKVEIFQSPNNEVGRLYQALLTVISENDILEYLKKITINQDELGHPKKNDK